MLNATHCNRVPGGLLGAGGAGGLLGAEGVAEGLLRLVLPPSLSAMVAEKLCTGAGRDLHVDV